MEEIDITICLKKIQKGLKNIKNTIAKLKSFLSFFVELYKMGKKLLIFGEEHIFHIFKKSINIDKVDIKRIVLSNKTSCGNKG